MPLLGGRLGRLLELWDELGQYSDEILSLVPLFKDLRQAQGPAAKAAVIVKMAKLFADDTATELDDLAIELVEEFLKHPELTAKADALLRAIGILKSQTAVDPDAPAGSATPAFGF